MLFQPLDAVLATTAKIQIIRALMPLESPVTGREAQRLGGVRSTLGAATALSELTALGILMRGGSSSTHQYRVNRDHHLEPALRALFDAEGRRIPTLKTALTDALTRAGVLEDIRSAVLFGSQARGDARPDSDLDVLFVTHAADSVADVERAIIDTSAAIQIRLGLRLAGIVIPSAQVRERTKQGDPLMEAIRTEGRGLLGEPFSEVVEKW
ncbi:MAG TPA: nucleotidyltransferase domain-containing protein [Longimicrobium sp.]|jgi:predicted nucleotidyltransferase